MFCFLDNVVEGLRKEDGYGYTEGMEGICSWHLLDVQSLWLTVKIEVLNTKCFQYSKTTEIIFCTG